MRDVISLSEWQELDERNFSEKVMDFLKDNKSNAYTAKSIADKLKLNRKTIQTIMSVLNKEGRVVRKKIMGTTGKKGEQTFATYYIINNDFCVEDEQ